jgi:hypothetical protein
MPEECLGKKLARTAGTAHAVTIERRFLSQPHQAPTLNACSPVPGTYFPWVSSWSDILITNSPLVTIPTHQPSLVGARPPVRTEDPPASLWVGPMIRSFKPSRPAA